MNSFLYKRRIATFQIKSPRLWWIILSVTQDYYSWLAIIPGLLVTTTIPNVPFSPDCWWHQFKTKIVWQEMISRALYYRCLNCFCPWLFPGNEYKWIEKCRRTWTAGGEIDSTVADISMLETEEVWKKAETRGEGRPHCPQRPRWAVSESCLLPWSRLPALPRRFHRTFSHYFCPSSFFKRRIMNMQVRLTAWWITLGAADVRALCFSSNSLCMSQTCVVSCSHISYVQIVSGTG